MRIAKLGHSCLFVEAAGARILVDPGTLSSVPDDVVRGPLDAVLITHAHGDHLDPTLLGRLEAAHPGLRIHACADAVAQLQAAGIAAADHGFADFAVGEARVEVLEAGHDPVLGAVPQNAAYRIADDLVITGDSTATALDAWSGTRVLALPAIAPWAARPQLAALMDRLRPESVFPVHDGFVVEAFRSWQDAAYAGYAAERGITYVTLGADAAEL